MDGAPCGFKWNCALVLQQRSEFKGVDWTGLVEGRQKTRRSAIQRGRSPMVSMQLATLTPAHTQE